MSDLRIAFAGDRDLAVWILEWILQHGVRPLALLVSGPERASHADALIAMCPFLGADRILTGQQFRQPEGLAMLRGLNLDYVIGIHFPYLVPQEVLDAPREGVLNLHPAYLPFNRGWHTPSWAILDSSPIGATLHFMDAGVDTGDIVHQRELAVSAGDTADTLYQSLKRLEFEAFKEAWPQLLAGSVRRQPQKPDAGRAHQRRDLLREQVQRVDLEETVVAGDLIRRLRALTTSRLDEAAYYEADGKRFRIQVSIHEETPPPPAATTPSP